jgi:hypothetical protein
MSGRHCATTPKSNLIIGSVAAAVGVSSVLSAVIVELAAAEPPSSPDPAAPRVVQQDSLSQQGRLIAVGPDSITTRGADGATLTFVLTPNTTAITGTGETGVTPASFAINDEVTVVGNRQGNTVFATAIAQTSAVGPAGKPMDFGL